MRSSQLVEWTASVGPLALVWVSAWLRFPKWLRNAMSPRGGKVVPPPQEEVETVVEHHPPEETAEPAVEMSLIDEMLSQSRYALLMRPQIAVNLSDEEVARTRDATLAHTASHNSRVAGHATGARKNAIRNVHAADVGRLGFAANEDDLLAGANALLGFLGSECNFPNGCTR